MKPLIPILIVATTSLAVASVQFAQQASVHRKRADAETQLRQKQDARVAELERNQARLERELATARAQNTPAPPPVAVPLPRPAVTRPPSAGSVAMGEPTAPGTVGPFEFRAGRGPMDSPAGRNFMRTRLKSSIRRLYGDAGQALGLSAEKSNELLDLLADQQTRNFGGMRDKIPEGQTFQQYIQDQQKKNAAEITALIGADKADEWAAYQKSLPQRMELGAVRDQLEQAGVPMNESQRTEMLAAITEESQRVPRPTFTQGIPPDEAMAQMKQWQTDYNKALMDRAKQVLNTEQYNAYKEYQDWQTEMRNNMPMIPAGPNGAPGMIIRSVTANGGVSAVGNAGPTVNFSVAAPGLQPLPIPPPPQTQNK